MGEPTYGLLLSLIASWRPRLVQRILHRSDFAPSNSVSSLPEPGTDRKYAEKSALARTASTQLYGNKCMPPRYSTYHYLLVSFTIAQNRMVNISSMHAAL